MHSDQAYIIEYSGTVEPIRIQLWELTSPVSEKIHILSKEFIKRRILWYAQ